MCEILEEMLRTGQVQTVDGSETVALNSAVTADVGEFLQYLIRQRKPQMTL